MNQQKWQNWPAYRLVEYRLKIYVVCIGLLSIVLSAVPSAPLDGVITSHTPAGTILFENKKPQPINRVRSFGISIEHLHHFTVWREGQPPVECLQRIVVE